jgi:hypothetical protein
MSITLPPLPVPAITMKHGPWKPSHFDDNETYCAHCLTRSIFAHIRRCNPRIDPESLRARDLEVARVVLEAAADLVDGNAACCSGQTAAILRANADAIRALEVRHHE